MLLDESAIVAANMATIEKSPEINRNLSFAADCVDVLRAYAYLEDLRTDDDITFLRLAVRLINAAGACGQCALHGYYQPAVAQIRDIIETGFLLDLFARKPDEISRWRTMPTKKDREDFKMVNVRKALDDLDNLTGQGRAEAYKFYSQHGTHADAWAIELISPDRMTVVGPFPDEIRLRGVSYDLAKFLGPATFYVIRGVDRTRIVNGKERLHISKLSAEFLSAMEEWQSNRAKS